MHTFDTPAPVTLSVRAGAGRVHVAATDDRTTTVELEPLDSGARQLVDEAVVDERSGHVVVHLPKRHGIFGSGRRVAITIGVPTGSTLEIKAESADVRARGTYAEATIDTGSGEIGVEAVTGAARLKSGSGAVTAGQVGGTLVIGTGSGDVNVDHTGTSTSVSVGSGDISIGDLGGEVVTKTGSGDVEVGILAGSLVTKTGSGDLTVRRAASGSVRATGASGDIRVGVQHGTAAWLDVSTLNGRLVQELDETPGPREQQERVEISAHTVSGDLRVYRS